MSAAHGEQVRILEEHGQEGGRSLNWWGMIFFIASEALIFANLIAAYLYLEIHSGQNWGQGVTKLALPAVNTVILLSSSVLIHFAEGHIRKGNIKQFAGWLTGTIVLGLTFLGGQVYEYINLYAEGKSLSSDIFGSAFFVLTGFHGVHVTIGVIFLVICLIRALRGHFTAQKHFAVEAGVMYWHFVDVVWIFVFSVVYLLPFALGGTPIFEHLAK
jgi:cytochrome c oxidase subunit 3